MISHSDARAAWDNLPQRIRDFYHNAHLRYDSFCRPGFTGDAYWFSATSGFNLFKANIEYQLLSTGSWDPQTLATVPNAYWDAPDPTLPRGSFLAQEVWDQEVIIPGLLYGYPAPARKVPKSYWTGVTRTRRNL